MSFWKKIKRTAIANRLIEEKLYEQVIRELESGVRRDGLWAKALQNSQGDEQKASALYIKYRVKSLIDEAEIANFLIEKHINDIVQAKTEITISNKEDHTCEADRKKETNKNTNSIVDCKGKEPQCKTCGFIAFNTDPEIATLSKCLGCGNIMDFSESGNENSDFKNRILCSDGCCIGVIGADGKCKVCGLPKVT